VTLQPGQTHTIGFRLKLVNGVREVDVALQAAGQAAVAAVPGYVCSPSMMTGQLLVRPPAGADVAKITGEGYHWRITGVMLHVCLPCWWLNL